MAPKEVEVAATSAPDKEKKEKAGKFLCKYKDILNTENMMLK